MKNKPLPFTDRHIRYFFKIAEAVASLSKDPSTKVGAVIVNNNRQILATGYNGFPTGYNDSPELYANKDFKYERTVHAEMNAILSAARNGIKTEGCSIFVTPLPVCNECAKAIIQAGIVDVHIKRLPNTNAIWNDRYNVTADLFAQCNVNVKIYE